jgi:aerobic C4-dicarboxylate transport protein
MKIFKSLYGQVLVAIIFGILLGLAAPDVAIKMRPLGEAFISLIKMIIGPIIFCTVVQGIATTGDMKKVGRVGGKALLYFEVVSTFALGLGLLVVNWIKPGHGFNVDPQTLDAAAVADYSQKAAHLSILDVFKHIIPVTFTDAFSGNGDLLQVLLVAILFGYALIHSGENGRTLQALISDISRVFFKIVNLIMKFAPVGAFGSMAFTIGKYGFRSFGPLLTLMGAFYGTCLIFIFLVLGFIARLIGFNIFKFIVYIKDELLTVLGTSSSESGLAPLMEKLERLGCSKSVVGLVVPAGYSFNLDGTNIYLTMAALFVAQALNVDLTLSQQLSLLLVATLTSKGASGVTGAGFITLAATLAVVPSVPVAGLALILGVDRFMSEARALTNIIGNGVATIVISRWENELDLEILKTELGSGSSVNERSEASA